MEGERLLGTVVDALAAFYAGQAGLPIVDRRLIYGKSRAHLHAALALHACLLVNSDLKGINLVRKRLEGPERAEETTLRPSLGEEGQNDDKTYEEGDKYDRLYQYLGGSNRSELRDCLKRAQPRAVHGKEKNRRGKRDHKQHCVREIVPFRVDILDHGFL